MAEYIDVTDEDGCVWRCFGPFTVSQPTVTYEPGDGIEVEELAVVIEPFESILGKKE